MNVLLAFCLIINLAAAGQPARVVTSVEPFANFSFRHANVELAAKPDESEAVKQTLLRLFERCNSGRHKEAASSFVYRGTDKKREWVDSYNYGNTAERNSVEDACGTIKALLEESDSYEFAKFSEDTEAEGRWLVWEVLFKRGEKQGKVSFALLKVKGRYAVGDIDGHLAYLRAIR